MKLTVCHAKPACSAPREEWQHQMKAVQPGTIAEDMPKLAHPTRLIMQIFVQWAIFAQLVLVNQTNAPKELLAMTQVIRVLMSASNALRVFTALCLDRANPLGHVLPDITAHQGHQTARKSPVHQAHIAQVRTLYQIIAHQEHINRKLQVPMHLTVLVARQVIIVQTKARVTIPVHARQVISVQKDPQSRILRNAPLVSTAHNRVRHLDHALLVISQMYPKLLVVNHVLWGITVFHWNWGRISQ